VRKRKRRYRYHHKSEVRGRKTPQYCDGSGWWVELRIEEKGERNSGNTKQARRDLMIIASLTSPSEDWIPYSNRLVGARFVDSS